MKRMWIVALGLFFAMPYACRYIPGGEEVSQPVLEQGSLLVFFADSVEYRASNAVGEIVSGLRDVRVSLRVPGRNPAYPGGNVEVSLTLRTGLTITSAECLPL